jgi:hypothetical protein
MRFNTRYRTKAICLAALLPVGAIPGLSVAVTATWINGTGNYSDTTKWDTPNAPCNAGATTFDVIIPADVGTISDDLTACAVDTLNLGDNGTLKILPGNSYTVLVVVQ